MIVAAVAFIAIGIAMTFGPAMLEGFETTRVDTTSFTETDNDTPIATDNTCAVTLTYPVWGDLTSAVTSVSSNQTSDNVSVNTVSSTSVNITGLDGADSNNRTITTTYDYGTVAQYTAFSTILAFGPTMILLGFVVSVGIIAFMGIKLWGKR